MNSDYIYCCENMVGQTFYHYDRQEAFEWYERNNGAKIWTKTKDLFPTITIIVDRPNVDINNIRENNIVNKSSVKKREYIANYDKEHTKQIKLKLNYETDKPILDKLKSVDNMQGYIKQLILKDIKNM